MTSLSRFALYPPPLLVALLRWRWPALACLCSLLLVACGGGGGAEETPAVERTSLIGRVQTTDVLAGATVQVESVDARTGAGQAAGAGTATETGLFSIPADLPPHSAVRVTAQGVDAQGALWGLLSAYTEAADPSQTVLQVNAVSTLVDRVRRLARLPLDQARAQVAASLELGAEISDDSSFADVTVFDHAALRQAQVDSGLTMDAYLDRLASQIVAEPQARHRFVRAMNEPAWDDPPRLQGLPFAGDIAAAAAKAALNKAAGSDSEIGAVLASLGFGSDARVLAQLQQINRKLDALKSAMDNTQQMIREGHLRQRTRDLEHFAGKIRTAQSLLEAIAGYKNEGSRRQAAREFNNIVEGLLNNTGVFSSALLGGGSDKPLAEDFMDLVWSEPSQKFYSWRHQERILAFLDYYDALNGALYLLYANYYRGLEVADPEAPQDLSENLATKAEEFGERRKQYLKTWPQRLDHERMFIGKTHRIVYSGVQGYGPAEKRLEHLRQFRLGGVEWFMPTTKYYEQQHGISNATGQKATQWLYRDFLDYAKSRNQAIGEAVVAAGAPEYLKGTGKDAIFLLNEDIQLHSCLRESSRGTCLHMAYVHQGYRIFDLANKSQPSYVAKRPSKAGKLDLSQPVPGNYHYIYARELTQKDRHRWQIPAF